MIQDEATVMATNKNTDNTTVKTEQIEVVDYNPQLHGPAPRLPRKYFGKQKINDQDVYFFYDNGSEDEDTCSFEEAMTAPRPFKVQVRILNTDDQKFVCVHPLVDETTHFEPRLPRSKHIKAFDAAVMNPPQPLLPQAVPIMNAQFKRVRHNICSSSVRTPVVGMSLIEPPARRFLDTNATMNIPSPLSTLSLSADSIAVCVPTEQTETANAETHELESRLLQAIPELTDADLDTMLQGSPSWYSN